MRQPYLIAGVVGVLLTAAFYEGKSAWTNRHRLPVETSGDETWKTACEDSRALSNSLARCQEQLAQKERESTTFASISSQDPMPIITEPPPPYPGDRFDPDPNEWRSLADQGRVKLSRPCSMSEEWLPGRDELQSVGLEEKDAQAVADVYKAAAARAWDFTRANCAEWLGVDASVAERLGSTMCESLLDMAAQKDEKVFRRVAEVRAGLRNESQLAPVDRYYLAKTKELKEFESDMAKRVGEGATRKITESATFCINREVWPELPQ